MEMTPEEITPEEEPQPVTTETFTEDEEVVEESEGVSEE